MINKLTELLSIIQATNPEGVIDLFIIAKMDEFTDKWSLLISTNWINSEEARSKLFDLVWGYLSNEIDESERTLFARVGIADSNTYLIRQIKGYLESQGIQSVDPEQPRRLESFKANGNIIHEAYLYALS